VGNKGEGILKKNDVTNYPIQSAAFHCLLWSLVRIVKYIRKYKMGAKVVGQIHDSILADVPVDEVDDYVEICRRIMTVDLSKHWKWIIVPMEVEVECTPVGGSWHEKYAYKGI
jgi:DNA polymerase I-like protein with 3'-5' exonuclease and polymerase domains